MREAVIAQAGVGRLVLTIRAIRFEDNTAYLLASNHQSSVNIKRKLIHIQACHKSRAGRKQREDELV